MSQLISKMKADLKKAATTAPEPPPKLEKERKGNNDHPECNCLRWKIVAGSLCVILVLLGYGLYSMWNRTTELVQKVNAEIKERTVTQIVQKATVDSKTEDNGVPAVLPAKVDVAVPEMLWLMDGIDPIYVRPKESVMLQNRTVMAHKIDYIEQPPPDSCETIKLFRDGRTSVPIVAPQDEEEPVSALVAPKSRFAILEYRKGADSNSFTIWSGRFCIGPRLVWLKDAPNCLSFSNLGQN